MSSSLTSDLTRVPLSAGFQQRMISGLLKRDPRLIACIDILDPEHFSAAGLPIVWATLKQYYLTIRVLPTWNIVKEQIYKEYSDADERKYFYRILRKCRHTLADEEVDFILRNVTSFGQLQKLANAYREALPMFERGDLQSVQEHLGRALLDGDTPQVDVRYFSTVKDRVKRRRKVSRQVVRTLITPLDSVLRDHGLRRQETGVVLASTGTGKTRMLVHLAKAAALQKLKVIYYTLQLPASDIEEILDATFSGVYQNQVMDQGERITEKVSKLGRQYGDSIII